MLALELKFLVKWPSKEQVNKHMPKSFQMYPNTRCIIDCTEFKIQKPSLPSSQKATYSSYKQTNTLKLLVGIAPNGALTYLSKIWSGNVSDRRLVEESDFLDLLDAGDDIMADRGFQIRDLLALRGCTLNIPVFSNGTQLSGRGTSKTRRIASIRIHVERAIGYLKNFKLLSQQIPLKICGYLDDIILTCAALCNLNDRIVN